MYLGFDNPSKSFINGDHLRGFVAGRPNLHRLDLLDKAVRDVGIQMAQAFLECLAEAQSGSCNTPASTARETQIKCLGFALEFEERVPRTEH